MDKPHKEDSRPAWLSGPGLLLVLILLVWPGPGQGAEFVARMVLNDAGKLVLGRIYVKGDKLRHEFVDERGHTVTIVRQDKKVIWVVLPPKKVYVEMPLKQELPGQFLQVPRHYIKKRRVCVETVSGYPVERIQLLVPGSLGPVVKTYWVSRKLGLPLKMECRERKFSVEYKDIREGPVADRLFEVPPGFRKLTRPTGLL